MPEPSQIQNVSVNQAVRQAVNAALNIIRPLLPTSAEKTALSTIASGGVPSHASQHATGGSDAISPASIGAATSASLTSHTGNTSNPHSTTKAQVGLANVDNTSDANKPVSTATQSALDQKVAALKNRVPFLHAWATLAEPALTETVTCSLVSPNTVPGLTAQPAYISGQSKLNPAFAFGGGVAVQQGAGSSIVARSCTGIARSIRSEFFCDSPMFEIIHQAYGSNVTRVLVGDQAGRQWREVFYTNDVSGGEKSIKVDFSSATTPRRVRRFRVESQNLGFGGCRVPAKDSLWAAPMSPRPVCVWVGDSITAGSNGRTADESYAAQAGNLLGWETHLDAMGGTGYLNPGTSVKFRDRISNVTASSPSIVVVSGGVNDRDSATYSVASVVAEANTYWTAIKTALPNALLIVMSPFKTSSAIDVANLNTALAAAAASASLIYIDTTGWVTGTGKVGSATGDGNADIVCSSDGIHPTTDGHNYLASRTAQEIRARLAS